MNESTLDHGEGQEEEEEVSRKKAMTLGVATVAVEIWRNLR